MRFFYLRDEHGKPIGCLASDLDKTTNTIKFAVSVCNPIDQFKKDQAKFLAAGKLAMEEGWTLSPSLFPKGMVKKTIMEMIVENSEFPQRARDAAKRWLKTHQSTDTANQS